MSQMPLQQQRGQDPYAQIEGQRPTPNGQQPIASQNLAEMLQMHSQQQLGQDPYAQIEGPTAMAYGQSPIQVQYAEARNHGIGEMDLSQYLGGLQGGNQTAGENPRMTRE